MRWHIDHAVVGREQRASAPGKTRESIQSRIELLESAEPLRRLGPRGMTGHVELRHVRVDERRGRPSEKIDRRLDALSDGGRDHEARTAQHGLREGGVAVARGCHDDRIDSGLPSGLEHRRVRLPAARIEICRPLAELLHHAVPRGIADGVAHHAVPAGGEPRRERGERRGRRGREARIDGPTSWRDRSHEAPGVTGARTQGRHPETVGEQHGGGARAGQGEPRRLPGDRCESTRQHVSE